MINVCQTKGLLLWWEFVNSPTCVTDEAIINFASQKSLRVIWFNKEAFCSMMIASKSESMDNKTIVEDNGLTEKLTNIHTVLNNTL